MKMFVSATLLLTLASAAAQAQVNAGTQEPEASLPFTMTQVATFNLPWRIAFLPDGRMLITEKVGPVWLVTQQGAKTPVANVPAVLSQGQGGMLGVYVSPNYATDHNVYLTYSEPGEHGSGSSLALARARLSIADSTASLDGLQVIWRDGAAGPRRTVRRGGRVLSGQAISLPDGRRPAAHDTRAGSRLAAGQDPAPDARRQTGARQSAGRQDRRGQRSPSSIRRATPSWPRRRRSYARTRFPGRTSRRRKRGPPGHRTPYGLAFAPDGRLWELEHGPRGGDELNLIEPGKNYGWPLVSYAINYDGVPIPSPDTRPDLAKPVIYWTPVIAPGNLTFYNGAMFPQWKGSALIGGLATQDAQPHHVRWKGRRHARRALERRPPDSRRGGRSGWRGVDDRERESGRAVSRDAEVAPGVAATSTHVVAKLHHAARLCFDLRQME